MDPATTTVLRSYPPELSADWSFDRFSGGDDTFDVLQLRAAETLQDSAPL